MTWKNKSFSGECYIYWPPGGAGGGLRLGTTPGLGIAGGAVTLVTGGPPADPQLALGGTALGVPGARRLPEGGLSSRVELRLCVPLF